MKKFNAVIEHRLIENITPYHGNTKIHPPGQIDKLASMISEYGHDVPIVVDGDGVIIKGHGRLLACKKLGMKTVPVIVRDDLTPAQAKAARIADNKVSESDWDMDMLKIELAELGDMDFNLDLTGFGDELFDDPFFDNEELKEKTEEIRQKNQQHILISVDLDNAIDIKPLVDQLIATKKCEVLYGAN